MNIHDELVLTVNKELEVAFPVDSSEELVNQLTLFINDLINRDFQKLVFILYRIDINENKLKNILVKNEGENAAGIIAHLIIEREIQKIKSRKEFGATTEFNNEEKWE